MFWDGVTRKAADTNGDAGAMNDFTPQPKFLRPRIGLALGGGAARGWAHIGVLAGARRGRLCARRHRRHLDRRGRRRLFRSGQARPAGGVRQRPDEAPRRRADGFPHRRLGSDLGRPAEASPRPGSRRHPHRGAAPALRGDRDRTRQRPRNLADAWTSGRGVARLLCPARRVRSREARRALAHGRRLGQSCPGHRRAARSAPTSSSASTSTATSPVAARSSRTMAPSPIPSSSPSSR